MTVLNLTKLGPVAAGSIVKNMVKISYCHGNIDIVSYCENFKGKNVKEIDKCLSVGNHISKLSCKLEFVQLSNIGIQDICILEEMLI